MSLDANYRELLAAVSSYVLDHDDPETERFKPALRAWGEIYQGVEPTHLAVSDHLAAALADCDDRGRDLLVPFVKHNRRKRKEQKIVHGNSKTRS